MSRPAEAPLRVVIAYDQASVREGLVLLLGLLPGIEVTAAAADGQRALDLVAEHHPDAIGRHRRTREDYEAPLAY
jgi:CheY-like chemotaxis protein